MFLLLCLTLLIALVQASDDPIYNVVVLGPTGVGKSSLMNMLAQNQHLFEVHHSSMSHYHFTSVRECRFLGKAEGLRMRLVDTQSVSNNCDDKKDFDCIRNMAEIIQQLEYVDLFIICFDGTNPRFTAYEQRIVSLFSQIFPDFLAHSVILFYKWKTPDDARRASLEFEYQKKINDTLAIPRYLATS